jgi:hypothetical protein
MYKTYLINAWILFAKIAFVLPSCLRRLPTMLRQFVRADLKDDFPILEVLKLADEPPPREVSLGRRSLD